MGWKDTMDWPRKLAMWITAMVMADCGREGGMLWRLILTSLSHGKQHGLTKKVCMILPRHMNRRRAERKWSNVRH